MASPDDPPESPGSLAFAPTRLRYMFMCTECGVPKLMPAIPQNEQGQTFHCAVCLEQQFFVRVESVAALPDLVFRIVT